MVRSTPGSFKALGGTWSTTGSHILARTYTSRPDVHTLVVEGGVEMITLFIVRGPIDYLDDDGEIVHTDIAQSKLERYEAHCRGHDLSALDVVF